MGRVHSEEMVFGRAEWLRPPGEEDKMREEWDHLGFFLREDFQFAERVL